MPQPRSFVKGYTAFRSTSLTLRPQSSISVLPFPTQPRRLCGSCADRKFLGADSRPASHPASSASNSGPSSLSSASSSPVTAFPSSPSDAPDHRTLATAQNLFINSSYSPGSPLFLPNGADLFNKLVNLLRAQYPLWGFREVITPTIYKSGLWKVSGHWENYAGDMFQVVGGDRDECPAAASTVGGGGGGGEPSDSTTDPSESEPFGLKPMNCPGHCLLFASQKRSYRDLPIRYADFSPLHRNELTGALSGLTRVRRFHQDDGHIFCTPSQIEREIFSSLDLVDRVYSTLGLHDYSFALSTRPDEGFIGTVEEWNDAEKQLKRALDKKVGKGGWTVKEGDGAFYGPKIDVMVKDPDGKLHQTATVQLDFQLPRRFNLTYVTDQAGLSQAGSSNRSSSSQPLSTVETESTPVSESEAGANVATPVMIHRAVLGSVERFLALLIEHYAGTYPFWLSPRPCAIVSVSNEERTLQYVSLVQDLLSGNMDAESYRACRSKAPSKPENTKVDDKESGASTSSRDEDALLERDRRYRLRPLDVPSIPITTDLSDRPLGAKLRHILSQKFAFVVVIGPRDVDAGTVNVRLQNVRGAKKEGFLLSSFGPVDKRGGGGERWQHVQDLLSKLAERGQANAEPETVRAMFEYLIREWK